MIQLDEQYNVLKPKYVGLMNAVKFTLEDVIERNNISLFELDGRVKTLDSVKEKFNRKNYTADFNEIEDFCGLRIVCYYTADMDLLSSIIATEFNVISESDKQKEAEDDRFGYLSRHFIVTLKEEWLAATLYSNYRDCKIEIQLRTMLMHTWAAISHKLLYKNERDAPKELKRRLNRLSALIELADEQFNTIRLLKDDYVDRLQADNEDKDIPLNSDGIISLVNKYSPGRVIDEDNAIPNLLDDIDGLNLSIANFEEKIIKALPFIDSMERKLAKVRGITDLPMWSMVGFCRVVLDLTSDEFFNSRWEEGGLSDFIESGRDSDGYWEMWKQTVKETRDKINKD